MRHAARKRKTTRISPVAVGVGALVAGYLLRKVYVQTLRNKQYYEPQADGSTVVYFGSDSHPTDIWVKLFNGGGIELHV